MTYPPQPGQPDPYGQGGWGQQPQSGGFPQQPPQSGGWQQQGGYPLGDPYGQGAQGGWQQGDAYAQAGGYGGPPTPPGSKKGLWVGLGVGGVALLAVGALLFTGFVAPGFFLSDPRAVVESLVQAVSDSDAEAAKSTLCPSSGGADEIDAEDIDEFKKESIGLKILGDAKEISGAEAHVPVEVNAGSITQTGDIVVKDEDGWCVSSFKSSGVSGIPSTEVPGSSGMPSYSAPPATGTTGVSGSATAAAQLFLDKVNAKDVSGALSSACSSSQDLLRGMLDSMVADGVDARLKGTPTDSTSMVFIDVEGTRKGNPATGSISVSSTDNGATWCVLTFLLF